MIPLAACLSIMALPKRTQPGSSRLVTLSLALLAVSQAPYLGRTWGKILFRAGLDHCPRTENRAQELRRLLQTLKEDPGALPVAATGYLIPRLIGPSQDSPPRDVFQLELPFTQPSGEYWIAQEIHQKSKLWPLGRPGLEKQLEELRRGRKSIMVFEGEWLKVEKIKPSP